jgi:hypothetical protein
MSIKESLLWHQMHVYELKFPVLFYPRALDANWFRVEFHANLQYKDFSSNHKLNKYYIIGVKNTRLHLIISTQPSESFKR